MNKGFEEIYEGMRVNRENFCLECVFSSEIELVYFRISFVHFGTVLNCFLFITTPRTKLKFNLRSGSTFIYSTKGFVFVNAS